MNLNNLHYYLFMLYVLNLQYLIGIFENVIKKMLMGCFKNCKQYKKANAPKSIVCFEVQWIAVGSLNIVKYCRLINFHHLPTPLSTLKPRRLSYFSIRFFARIQRTLHVGDRVHSQGTSGVVWTSIPRNTRFE